MSSCSKNSCSGGSVKTMQIIDNPTGIIINPIGVTSHCVGSIVLNTDPCVTISMIARTDVAIDKIIELHTNTLCESNNDDTYNLSKWFLPTWSEIKSLIVLDCGIDNASQCSDVEGWLKSAGFESIASKSLFLPKFWK